jgi:signal transduction histidine kinase
MSRVAWFAAWPTGLAVGALTVLFARSDPDLAFASTPVAIAVELLAGYGLIASGLMSIRRDRNPRFGWLLAAAGCGWFLLEWPNPAVGSPVVFTSGLLLYGSAAPLLAHALLSYRTRSLRPPERVAVLAAYAGSVLALGLLSALVYDPAAQGCSQCPANLLLVHANADLYRQFNRAGIYLGLLWTALVIGLVAWQLAGSTVAVRLRLAPVLVAGCAYLGLVGADFAVSAGRGFLASDPVDQHLWDAQAAALVLVTLAVAWSWLRTRRARAKLAQLVLELSRAPSPGRLEQALARSLGDPGLHVSYRLANGSYVQADGSPAPPGPQSTALVRDRLEVARLTHRAGLLDEPGLAETLLATASLPLEHERLRAELLAQLADLRDSRTRIVAAGDAERRRLERNLHDGAQQQLVAFSLALGVRQAQLAAAPEPDRALIDRLQEAQIELRAALNDLRELAEGIFPAVLADEGLAAAVEALAEQRPGSVHILTLPVRRLSPAVESAAYRLIAQTVSQAGRHPVLVTAVEGDGRLLAEIASDRPPPDLTDLEDRVGALDGTLELERLSETEARLVADIPCES